jgi:hypothetical protein
MPEIPSVSQNLLQQKYGQKKETPPKEEFQMAKEKGIVSRADAKDAINAKIQKAQTKKARPSAILDLSPEAKKILSGKSV